MPPKKVKPSIGVGGLLKQYKKDVKQQAQQSKKEIEISDLTAKIVQETTQITVLKVWAKKLGMSNIVSYKSSDIEDLRKAILVKLAELKPELIIKEDREDEDIHKIDDNEAMKQYNAIEKFLKSYSKNPLKTSSIYGKLGNQFNQMWKEISPLEQYEFITDYFEFNVGLNKVNPVLYLKGFVNSLTGKQKETPGRILSSYLRLFIKNIGNPTDKTQSQMEELSKHALFPRSFLIKFSQLGRDIQIKFAGFYLRGGSGYHRNPIDSLELYLNPPKEVSIKRLPVKTLFTGGMKLNIMNREVEETKLNDYRKCSALLRKLEWIIRPMDKESQNYLSIPSEIEGFYLPSDSFYTDLCQYHSYVRSPNESIVVINTDKRIIVEVRLANGGIANPSKLSKDLQIAQTGNIFVKLTPWWILNTPIYQIDPIYLDQPDIFLHNRSGINFHKIIGDLRKSSRYESYQTYLTRFVVMFFPFFENLIVDASGKKTKKDFFITSQVRSGYITHEAYANMSISQKVPEANVKRLVETIEGFMQSFSYAIVNGVGKNFISIKPIEFFPLAINLSEDIFAYSPDVFSPVNCPEESEYYPQDLIVYQDRCFVIPELISRFMNHNHTDPKTGKDLEKDFVEDVVARYRHLISEKFQKKPRMIKNEEGEDVEEPGEVFYIDKNMYDKAHPVIIKSPRKDKYTKEDLSDQFNRYFNVTHIILDPVALVKGLMNFDPQTKCQSCEKLVGKLRATSAVNRSDGSIIELSFCDYQCMSRHDFQPMHVVEEELDLPIRSGDIVNKV